MSEEIDLHELLFILLRRRLIAFFISTQIIVPKYTASASLYVYNNKDERMDNTITSTDLNTSQQLVQTYIVILTSNTVLQKVTEELNGQYSVEELRNMISASAIDKTEAFQVSVTNEDAAAAAKIANTIVRVAPNEIIRVVKAGGVEVIDYATQPKAPSSPNVLRNTAIGAILGFVVSALISVMLELFNTTIRCEEDLTEHFDYPVLGVIPALGIREEKAGNRDYGPKIVVREK